MDLNSNAGHNINGKNYVSVTSSKTNTMNENIEQIILSLSNSINSQLANISATLTAQIASLATKIDEHKQKTFSVEQQIQKAIIPAIQELAKFIDDFSQQKANSIDQQTATSTCSEMVNFFVMDQQQPNVNISKSKKRGQRKTATQTRTNVLN